MNKNALIGLLVAVVVLGGGYLLLKKPMAPAVNQTSVSTTTSGNQTSGTTPDTSAPAPTAGAPTVIGSANNVTWGASAVVTGQANPNGAATSYWFDYGTTTAFGTQTAQQAIGSGYLLTATPAYITGLRSNTLYYFRLSAKNAFATVSGPTYTFTTNNNPPPQGSIPTARTNSATDISRSGATINGQVNPDGSATTYWFEYGRDMGLGNATSMQSLGSGSSGTAVSFPLTNLSPLTQYYFRVDAQNQYGTVNGAIMSFKTTGPTAVTAPSVSTTNAVNIATTSAQLTGRINPNGADTTYWFEYSEDSLLGSIIGSGTAPQILSAGNSTSTVRANATGLKTNTKYYYRLVGRNSVATVRGDIVSFRTK